MRLYSRGSSGSVGLIVFSSSMRNSFVLPNILFSRKSYCFVFSFLFLFYLFLKKLICRLWWACVWGGRPVGHCCEIACEFCCARSFIDLLADGTPRQFSVCVLNNQCLYAVLSFMYKFFICSLFWKDFILLYVAKWLTSDILVFCWKMKASGSYFNDIVNIEQLESISFNLNDSKRYRRTVGSIAGSCITAATPLLASTKQAACLVALDIVEVIYCLSCFFSYCLCSWWCILL